MPHILICELKSFMILKKRFSKGVTLIEVVLAALIAAMTTTAIYSVVLSGFVSESKADKREAAALVLKTAQEVLKSYVAVEPSNNLYILPGTPPGNWSAEEKIIWALEGDTSKFGLRHDISSLLSGTPLQPDGTSCKWLLSCYLVYQVKNIDCGLGVGDKVACKKVKFILTYAN